MQIIEMPTGDLIPYENNPRNNAPAVKAVAESIQAFGFKVPIVIDKENVIVCGHTRLLAALRLGLDTVPCVRADDLTDEQVKAFRLADNKTSELAEWDFTKLEQELAELDNWDMSAFGFDIDNIEEVKEAEDDPEEIAKQITEPTTKLGDIWQLGEHRLICGDSTDRAVLERLMQGEEADLLLTDPPYNIDYEGGTGLKIQNDNWSDDTEFIAFLTKAFKAALEQMHPGAAFYIWYADTQALNFRKAAVKSQMQVRQNLIWAKNTFTFGRQDYQWRHEPCLYGWKDGAAHYFTDSRTESTVIEDNIDINKLRKDEMKNLLKELLSDKTSTTVIHEDKPIRNSDHPTMKPLKLLARLIKNSTKPGDLVLDVFGGSGSTLIACEQLNRKCYMCELDPKYCDVIVKRWEELTGNKAVLINGQEKQV